MIDLIHTYWLYFLVGQYPNGPLGGLALTVLLAALALVLALPIGPAAGPRAREPVPRDPLAGDRARLRACAASRC